MEPMTAPSETADQGDGTAPTTPGGRKLKRSTRIALIVLLILALVAAGGFATSYLINARNYVSTDNALVDGDKIKINAPASGTLVDWSATLGAVLHQDQVVGRIKIQNGFTQPLMSIRAPADGTVAEDDSLLGAFVNAGTQLAVAYNMAKIYVTANVDETDLKSVHIGQAVDMYVDAYPHARLTGRVREITQGAASQFSLFPQNNSQGNFQKITQVIPVKIGIENHQGLDLAPGMNVTVYIHKH
ncbi:MAG: HlyD family efflux transporter periplasmic adaptor subunit [Pseudonocardiales bacterium]|nr:HlyD family efflux transporter periplasmic adaptor subunit [Pseudonocardiales bacterium]